jgi:hypothetical protein
MLTTTSRQTRYSLHRRMLVNLAVAWVTTLMISAYYVFSVLATVS